MKKKLTMGLMLVAAVSMLATGCGSKKADDTQDTATKEETKEPEQYLETMKNTDENDMMMKDVYGMYSAGDFTAIVQFDTSDEMHAIAQKMIDDNPGIDRYVCEVSDNVYGMLFVSPAKEEGGQNGYWWYFGEMSNGIRQGKGVEILASSADENLYEIYTGNYDADFPTGQGVMERHTNNSNYTIEGDFTGGVMNGSFTVQMDLTESSQTSEKNELSYSNNHLTGSLPFETELKEGQEVFLYAPCSDGKYLFFKYNTSYLDYGFSILRGNENILTK